MKYLGIDYGLKKIGLAISEGQLASIYKVLDVAGLNDAVSKIEEIIKKEDIERIVLGIPESGQIKDAALNFSKKLSSDEYVVIETPETLSTQNAQGLMRDLNLSKKQRQSEDAYSAALILQNFLDTLS